MGNAFTREARSIAGTKPLQWQSGRLIEVVLMPVNGLPLCCSYNVIDTSDILTQRWHGHMHTAHLQTFSEDRVADQDFQGISRWSFMDREFMAIP